MMHKPAINLLLLGLPDSDAEQLTSGLRRAGQVARELRLDSGEDLAQQLTSQRWDLLVFDAERSQLDIRQCGQLLRKFAVDLPIIYVGEGNPLAMPDPAVVAVFNKYEFPRLVSSALREVAALRGRLQLEETQRALAAAEQRSQLLLSESADAIAYIIDGMIVHANRAFCASLEHDDLDGFPLIDLVSARDQERLKNALKQAKGAQGRQLELNFLRRDGSEHAALLLCSNAVFDDEQCVQLTVQAPDSAVQVGGQDPSTGMAGRQPFYQILQDFIDHERNGNSSLLLLSIDQFSPLRSRLGLQGVESLVAALATSLRARLNAQYYGRIGDDIFAAIAHLMPSNSALDMATELVREVEAHIFEVKKRSLQCSMTVAIVPINHLTPPHAGAVLDNGFHFLEKLHQAGGSRAEIYRRDRQQLENRESPGKMVADAIGDQRLQLLFEAMVNLGDARGDHYEVSLDLKERQDGEITAGELLRSIEREPENIQLDRWIVMEATKQLAKERLSGQDIKLVINLSGNVFHDLEFCSWLGVAIMAAGLQAGDLTLQFSEESIGNSLKPALDFCKQFQRMGGSIGVRNFGRVKGAEKFLGHIQPALVKPGFRQGDALDSEQTRELICRAKGLDSRIVIPHVGSAAALAMLWQLGPDFIQGSYVHEPVAAMNYEFAAFS